MARKTTQSSPAQEPLSPEAEGRTQGSGDPPKKAVSCPTTPHPQPLPNPQPPSTGRTPSLRLEGLAETANNGFLNSFEFNCPSHLTLRPMQET